MKIKLINIKTNKEEEVSEKNIIETLYYNTHKLSKKTTDIKNYISNIETKIPLYDVYTNNLYLIYPENLYNRVSLNHYRFPKQEFINNLKKEVSEIKDTDIISIRRKNKFNLMVEFLDNFNLNILEDTFYRTMYKYSPELGRNITFCKRKSFNKYIHNSKPYYSRTEIINLARNMGKDIDVKNITEKLLTKLCSFVSKNDISADILLEHQKYIVENNMLGLVQYYTITGSTNLNTYLRNPELNYTENSTFNSLINNLTILCNNSPAFDNDYIIYRFIKSDDFLQHLKIGNIYTDNAFMSTTRDPFYRSDTYSFGFILVKIHIPKNIKGIGLCLEACSHFQEEQEIIFPPGTQFKLIARDNNITYHHTDINFTSKISTKYEFEWIGHKKIKINNRVEDKLRTIDFLNFKPDKSLSLTERIKKFTNNLSTTQRFNTKIGDKEFIVCAEKYNSVGAYKKFFAIKTTDGFSMYCILDNYLLFMLEIGTVDNIDELHVNYYVKYNTLDVNKILKLDDLVRFIAEIAYYFALDRVIIYSTYKPCATFTGLINQRLNDKNTENNNQEDVELESLIGNYCLDFYEYLKDNKKRYLEENILEIELSPQFSYYDLDYLKNIKIEEVLDKSDDELYQIYDKYYKLEFPKDKVSQYLLWIIENKCYLTDKFINKLGSIFKINPFKRDMYVLNPYTYLYNRGVVTAYNIYYEGEITEREHYSQLSNEYKKTMSRDMEF